MHICFNRKSLIFFNIKQCVVGCTFLLFGVLIYLVARCPDQISFIYILNLPSLYTQENGKIFGELANNLPSFIHVCAFSLLTCAFLPSGSKKKFFIVCISWANINILCEIGQLIKPNKDNLIFTNINAFNYFLQYFQYGTFDYFDIIFALIGSIFAYSLLVITFKGG